MSTILDEVMAWALVDHDIWGVTARMAVEFRKPVPIGRPIRAEGRVTQARRRIVEAEGVILDPADGTELARATGLFVGAPEARKAELKARYGFALGAASATPDRGGTRRARARRPRARGARVSPVATAPSPATARARALVAERKPDAVALGRRAGDLVNDPAALVAELRDGLPALADPEYLDGMRMVVPGVGPVLGVRQPLLQAIGSGLRSATRHDRPTTLLDVADRLLREETPELRWLAYGLLERTVREEPERTWQLVRAEGRRAGEWASVDMLAHVAAIGIAAEPYRWAELEQLVYSPSRWERRLAASTIATLPHEDHDAGRSPATVGHALGILGDLVGDAEPDVQKALSWALRTLAEVDLPATVAFLRREAATAAETDDGHRAWVVRDSLSKLPDPVAHELRAVVDGIRRRPGAPPTSRASATAADFLSFGLAVPPAERTTIDRT